MPHARGRTAFSLLELLVVIAVIAVLISILLPTLAHARENARQVVCASNLRQIASAYLMYAKSNRLQGPAVSRSDVLFPDDWLFWQEPPLGQRRIDNSALADYLGAKGPALRSLFRCPTDPLTHAEQYPYSYSMNTGLWRVYWEHQPRLPITKVRNPSDKSLFYDEDNGASDGAFWYAFGDNLTDRHHARGNIAFFDAHVELEYPTFAHEQPHNDPTF